MGDNVSNTLDLRRQLRGFDPTVHVVLMYPGPRLETVTQDEAARRILASTPDANADELRWNLEPVPGRITVAEHSESGWLVRHMPP